MKQNLMLILFSSFVLIGSGCSIVRQPSAEEYESVRQNKKAIVLFRLTGSIDSKDVHLLVERLQTDYFNLGLLSFGLTNLDADEPMKKFPPVLRSELHFSPSPHAAKNGWGAFLLEPGTYYLRITWASSNHELFDPIPEFRFTVPPKVSLLYIGSLHLSCTTKKTTTWFWGRDVEACAPEGIPANEESAANVLAQESFRAFGSLSTMIMKPYDTALPAGMISTMAPVGFMVPRGKIELGSPEWMRRALGIGLAPSAGLLALVSGGGGGAGPGAAGAVALAIFWAPVGTILGYLGGKWSESSWEPCRQALQQALIKFDPMAVLATKLKSALDNNGVPTRDMPVEGSAAANADVKKVLVSQIRRVVLRLCPSSSLLAPALCLDVSTRARLFETATQTYVYDRVFVHSNGQLELQPYESVVQPESIANSSGRDPEAYCAAGGGEILQGDLSNALDAIVNQIVRDLGLAVE